MHSESITIAVEHQHVCGTLAVPATGIPGILFLHGWSGSQENDLARANELAALGCACLTFDLRGHAGTENLRPSITPEHNLQDALAAYDVLVRQPMVDKSAIAVIGSSYGAYLSTILTSCRPVRWLALRAPAIYRDAHWTALKGKLDRLDLTLYRQQRIDSSDNTALDACAKFGGDVLLVESERDDYVPHPTVANYIAAFGKAHSLTYRVVGLADHALSDERSRQAYTSLLVGWVREMVLGAR